jgi:hypothetical protein
MEPTDPEPQHCCSQCKSTWNLFWLAITAPPPPPSTKRIKRLMQRRVINKATTEAVVQFKCLTTKRVVPSVQIRLQGFDDQNNESKENIHMKFLNFFYLNVDHFCPPRSGSLIRIGSTDLNPIQIRNPASHAPA